MVQPQHLPRDPETGVAHPTVDLIGATTLRFRGPGELGHRKPGGKPWENHGKMVIDTV